MTVHASFDAQTQYGPSDLMQRDADWIAPGVVTSSDLQVTAQSPAAMAVNVAGGPANAPGGNAWLPGGYRLNNDAQLALTVAAANATNPRIDIVVAGVNTSTNPYTPEVKIITGTPAAGPVAPATPTGYLLLANIAVAAGATSIAQANITDKRVVASLQGNGSALTGVVTASELGAPNGAASLDANGHVPVGQLANAVLTSEVGAANGVATLDSTGHVPDGQIESVIARTNVSQTWSQLQSFAGGFGGKYHQISAATSMDGSYLGGFVEIDGSATYTTTLPDPTVYFGGEITIMNNSSTTQTLSTPKGNIYGLMTPGQPTYTLVAPQFVKLIADGGNWVVVVNQAYSSSSGRQLSWNGSAWVDPLKYQ